MALRFRTTFPLVAIFSIAFFFWCMRRYDQATFLRFRQHPVDSTQPQTPKPPPVVEVEPQPIPPPGGSLSDSINEGSTGPPSTGGSKEGPTGGSSTGGSSIGNTGGSSSSGSGSGKSSSKCEVDPVVVPLPFNQWLPHKNYTRAYFRPHFVSPKAEFSSLENINSPVLSPFTQMGRGTGYSPATDSSSPCPKVVDVDVAAEENIDETAKILFGLATEVSRLEHLLPSLLYSYGNSKAGLLVLVPETEEDLSVQQTYFRNRGLDVTLKASPLDFTARYFGMVQAFAEFVRTERPWTTWLGFMDDDTFMLSLPAIATELNMFDATKKHYLGTLSEASWQVDTFGHIGFGGAGVFVSKPLLDVLEENYDECQSWGEQPGDQKLGQCIQRFGDVQMTLWPALYQMDMHGDVDGFYESGRKILSLHHWNTWYTKDVVKMSSVAAAAGRRSVLRRWVFDHEEVANPLSGRTFRSFWILTNGYSLVKYTYDENTPNDAISFDQVEKTWDEEGRGFEERLGLMRPMDQAGVFKDRWIMKESYVVGDNVHQLYIREEAEGRSIIEIIWLGPKGGGGAGVGGELED